jgi:hypothetical protein
MKKCNPYRWTFVVFAGALLLVSGCQKPETAPPEATEVVRKYASVVQSSSLESLHGIFCPQNVNSQAFKKLLDDLGPSSTNQLAQLIASASFDEKQSTPTRLAYRFSAEWGEHVFFVNRRDNGELCVEETE